MVQAGLGFNAITRCHEVSGALICGGTSKRFGRDKRFYLFQGKTFLETSFHKLSLVCKEASCVFRDKIPKGLEKYPAILDDPDVEGPMAGILSALKWTKTPYVLCLACDVPKISERFLFFLCSFRKENTAIILRVETLEPLISIYPALWYQKLKSFSQKKSFSLMQFLEQLPKEQKRIIEPQKWERLSFHKSEFENFNYPLSKI